MNRRNCVKSNEDQSVAECCGLINHPLKIDLKFIILLRYNEREMTRKLKSVTQSKIVGRTSRSSSLLVQKILQTWIEGVVEEVPSLLFLCLVLSVLYLEGL